jgi:hypothetical protein
LANGKRGSVDIRRFSVSGNTARVVWGDPGQRCSGTVGGAGRMCGLEPRDQWPSLCIVVCFINRMESQDVRVCAASGYRGTSLIRNTHPPRITVGPKAKGYCSVLLGGGGLVIEVPL